MRLWTFDEVLINFCQFFHVSQPNRCRRVLGIILAFFGLLLNFVCTYELWIIVTLCLAIFQQDAPSRILNYFLLLNVLTVQSFKRFISRKRPGNLTQPRANSILKDTSSSLPSRVVVLATTLTFALLSVDSWQNSMARLNSTNYLIAIIAQTVMFFVASFLKVNLGSCYPSDCIFSAFAILIIYSVHFTVLLLDLGIKTCKTCGRNEFCYYE